MPWKRNEMPGNHRLPLIMKNKIMKNNVAVDPEDMKCQESLVYS